RSMFPSPALRRPLLDPVTPDPPAPLVIKRNRGRHPNRDQAEFRLELAGIRPNLRSKLWILSHCARPPNLFAALAACPREAQRRHKQQSCRWRSIQIAPEQTEA